ncbi:unnamed protein product [Microthlaspi erraticum]|uniref:Leucine-rich repeat-containing N-terminal plant-type domain-containing protein n=1 Tax=Microthlaspi erraticum TaxID=1685480 RepID=A0A6D2HCR0_9BRAS|nr:unnamed protein product [Microthlaspi erraticum]
MLFNRFLCTSFLLFLFFLFGCASSATLPTQEVEAFKVALTTLKKTNVAFNEDPCEGSSSGSESSTINRWKDVVTCDCSFASGTICHVTKIRLKENNLQGSLPKEFVGLTFLQEIDLSRNYLNGSIPPEWGVLPLVNISLLGNRLTGPIPKEIGNIKTLTSLVLEANELSGELPSELGNLPNIKQMFIQASGLVGPIPISIDSLAELKDLRISDLNGPESSFPPLKNMKKMETL